MIGTYTHQSPSKILGHNWLPIRWSTLLARPPCMSRIHNQNSLIRIHPTADSIRPMEEEVVWCCSDSCRKPNHTSRCSHSHQRGRYRL